MCRKKVGLTEPQSFNKKNLEVIIQAIFTFHLIAVR